MRRARGVFLLALLCVVCPVIGAAHAEPVDASSSLRTALVSRAVPGALAREGSVNVFVMLRGFTPADRTIAHQRWRATDVEQRVLDALPSGVHVYTRLSTVPAFAARLSSLTQLRSLERQPDVLRIDLDGGGGTGATDTATIIGADKLHQQHITGSGVTVAVLDSGVDKTHPDLVGSVVREACFGENFSGGFCPNGTTRQTGAGAAADDAGHGTHVTGIIRSTGHVAPIGVAPATKIVAIKVTDGSSFSGRFYAFSEITAALDYIAAHPEFGVRVVNMSLVTDANFSGNCDDATSWLMAGASAVANLRNAGVEVVASSGNGSLTNAMTAPACLSGVLSVAASDSSDAMASFSDTSATTDLVAPGVAVVSDAIGGGTITASGTSMASPAVAGCVALLRQAKPKMPNGTFEVALKTTGTAIKRGKRTFPRINCDRALTALNTAPGAPTGVVATPGDSRMNLRWTAPKRNGSLPVSGYRVTPYQSGNALPTRTFKGAATHVTVSGLTNGRPYTFVVSAMTLSTHGKRSVPSDSVVAGSPAPPTQVHAQRVASGVVRVTFVAGANNGATITSFTATCRSPAGPTRKAAAAHSPIAVTGLQAGRRYTCVVAGRNARGTGPPSSASNGVLA